MREIRAVQRGVPHGQSSSKKKGGKRLTPRDVLIQALRRETAKKDLIINRKLADPGSRIPVLCSVTRASISLD